MFEIATLQFTQTIGGVPIRLAAIAVAVFTVFVVARRLGVFLVRNADDTDAASRNRVATRVRAVTGDDAPRPSRYAVLSDTRMAERLRLVIGEEGGWR